MASEDYLMNFTINDILRNCLLASVSIKYSFGITKPWMSLLNKK